MKPKPLNPGQTVFYMVQPRFMNVDIRVMVDVTQGALDLFLSPRDDSFVVTLNSSTGYQDVRLFYLSIFKIHHFISSSKNICLFLITNIFCLSNLVTIRLS